jgi:hypothetical protein
MTARWQPVGFRLAGPSHLSVALEGRQAAGNASLSRIQFAASNRSRASYSAVSVGPARPTVAGVPSSSDVRVTTDEPATLQIEPQLPADPIDQSEAGLATVTGVAAPVPARYDHDLRQRAPQVAPGERSANVRLVGQKLVARGRVDEDDDLTSVAQAAQPLLRVLAQDQVGPWPARRAQFHERRVEVDQDDRGVDRGSLLAGCSCRIYPPRWLAWQRRSQARLAVRLQIA